MRNGPWFCTFTGKQYFLLDPHPDDICIEDIAHALSLLCRFGCHIRTFYSVAQHSVFCAGMAFRSGGPLLQMHALLHDASEAFLGDLVRPLKQQMPVYKDAEDKTQKVIYQALGLPLPTAAEHELIKRFDNTALLTERNNFLNYQDTSEWDVPGQSIDVKIRPWSPKLAEKRFLKRFFDLRAKVASTP